MTTLNQELYEALIAAGAPEDTAKRAAASVYDSTELATKLDIAELRGQFTELRGEFTLVKWMLGFNLVLSFAILGKLLT